MKYVIYSETDDLYYTRKDLPCGKPIFNRNIMSSGIYENTEDTQKDTIRLKRDNLIITEYYK